MDIAALQEFLADAIQSAQGPNTELVMQHTMSAETESLSANVTVRFAPTASQASVSLLRLVKQLGENTTIGSVDVVGPPSHHIVVQGSLHAVNYKIVFEL